MKKNLLILILLTIATAAIASWLEDGKWMGNNQYQGTGEKWNKWNRIGATTTTTVPEFLYVTGDPSLGGVVSTGVYTWIGTNINPGAAPYADVWSNNISGNLCWIYYNSGWKLGQGNFPPNQSHSNGSLTSVLSNPYTPIETGVGTGTVSVTP